MNKTPLSHLRRSYAMKTEAQRAAELADEFGNPNPSLNDPHGKWWAFRPQKGQTIQKLKNEMRFFSNGVWDTSEAKDEDYEDVGIIDYSPNDVIFHFTDKNGKRDSIIWAFYDGLNSMFRWVNK